MEFLYSDEGQNIWLKGELHTRSGYDDLSDRDAIPAEVLANLPDIRARSSRRSPS